MNKYRHHTKAFLNKNLRKNVMSPILDEVTEKGILEDLDNKIMRVFSVTRKMFEILNSSELTADGKATAVDLLRVLQSRMGDK